MIFMTDIKELFNIFDKFTGENVMAMAHEGQPTYRYRLSWYRVFNPGTPVGGPPPDGRPGFNSGVVLIDLDKARTSRTYARYLDGDVIKQLTEKYFFRGHLGDQDLFTLIGQEKPDLFYVLPCTWNRQLCIHWGNQTNKYGPDIFNSYHNCSGTINVYHGNGNVPINV